MPYRTETGSGENPESQRHISLQELYSKVAGLLPMSQLFSPLLERALRFAADRHRNQTRKATDIPYITHPISVAWILQRAGFDDEVLLAAALLAGAPALLAPAWARHRHRRAMLHALRQARDLAQSGDAMALYTHLERHAAQDAGAALRPARAALGTMLFSPGGQTSLKDIERLLPERT